MQTLSGIIVGAFEPLADGARSEAAYRALFGVLTLVLIAAVAIYSRSRTSSLAMKCAPAGNSLKREAITPARSLIADTIRNSPV